MEPSSISGSGSGWLRSVSDRSACVGPLFTKSSVREKVREGCTAGRSVCFRFAVIAVPRPARHCMRVRVSRYRRARDEENLIAPRRKERQRPMRRTAARRLRCCDGRLVFVGSELSSEVEAS
jgi:hypothetical protein